MYLAQAVQHGAMRPLPGAPLPIATRTQRYYHDCGVRTVGG